MKWIAKAIVQKTISILPFNHKINFLFQKYITKGVYLSEEYFIDKLNHLQNHIAFFEKWSANSNKENYLELGTGWYPVLPIGMFLYGFENVYTVDITSLTNKDRIFITLKKFMEFEKSGKLKNYFKWKPERLVKIKYLINEQSSVTADKLFSELHFNYQVQDARHLSYLDASFDLVTSNNTFEHIYPEILNGILVELRRISKPGGIMSHHIDMSDHFAHLDKSITIYNFFKFSDRQWKWIDNSIQPQNRLRLQDYLKLYDAVQIPVSEIKKEQGFLHQLRQVRLNDKFKRIPEADLAVSHIYLVSMI